MQLKKTRNVLFINFLNNLCFFLRLTCFFSTILGQQTVITFYDIHIILRFYTYHNLISFIFSYFFTFLGINSSTSNKQC